MATFEVSNLSAPGTAQVSDTITVAVTLANTGDVEGTTTAEFVFAGQTLLTENVTLAGGESTTVTFDVPVTDDIAPGTYTHGVVAGDGEQTAQITIEAAPTTTQPPETSTAPPETSTAPPETSTAPPETTEPMGTTADDDGTTTESGGGGGGLPGFTIGLSIVALLALTLLALRRQE